MYVLRKNTVPQVGEFLGSLARDQGVDLPTINRHLNGADDDDNSDAIVQARPRRKKQPEGCCPESFRCSWTPSARTSDDCNTCWQNNLTWHQPAGDATPAAAS